MAIFFLASCRMGSVQTYTVGSTANQPTLQLDQIVLIKKQQPPQRLDFIAFHATDHFLGSFVAIYRLCGLEGDRVEIRKGVAYVNGRSIDDQLSLKKTYLVQKEDLGKIAHLPNVQPVSENELLIDTTEQFLRDMGLRFQLDTINRIGPMEDIWKVWNQLWTMDNFGPVTVPPGHYFVLGDNRHGAADSRFRGFIARDSLVGVVHIRK
jgi:signal peptidase I